MSVLDISLISLNFDVLILAPVIPKIIVKTEAVDNYCKKNQFEPDFIKIDCEGAELNVLKGLKKTIKSKALKSILIEINPNFKEHQKCVKILLKEFSNYKKINVIKNSNIHNIVFSRI